MKDTIKDYNLVDIHFHTCDSYDTDSAKYNFPKMNEVLKNNDVKLIVKTDHNKFGFGTYNKMIIEMPDIKILPGIELNIVAKNKHVHWLVILNDNQLNEENMSLLESYIDNKLPNNTDSISHKDFINFIFENKIECICIPHLDKTSGYTKNNNREEMIELLDLLVNGIVIGFESKSYSKYFEKEIEKITNKIDEYKINTDASNKEMIDYKAFQEKMEQIRVSSEFAIIFGSDMHLKGNITNGSFLASIEDYSTLVNNLFYMKAKPTYEGLKLSLLDQQSRIKEYLAISNIIKSGSNVIDKIKFRQDEKIVEIDLSDGINSIIGLRGSGKSYLANAIINNVENYNKKIRSENCEFFVKFCDEENWFPSSEISSRIEFIGQKNSAQKENKNLYSMLTDAPYDTTQLIKIIRDNIDSNAKKEKENIKKVLNDFFGQYRKIHKICESECETAKLNEWMVNKVANQDQKVIDILNDTFSKNTNSLKHMTNRIEKIEEVIESIDKIINFQLLESEVKLLPENKISLDFSQMKDYKNILTIIVSKYKDSLNRGNKLNKIIEASSINKTNKLDVKNQEINLKISTLEENIKNLVKYNKKILERKDSPLNNDFISEEWVLGNNLKIKLLNNLPNYESENIVTKINNSGEKELHKIELFKFEEYSYEKLIPILNSIRVGTPIDETFIKLDYIEDVIVSYNTTKSKNIKELSPGERSNIVLDIVLNENSFKPIILDQPEDDLDNSTIYNLLVQKLRKLKFKRQIIIVSHNANVVINSDSDRIIYCSRFNNTMKYETLRFEENNSIPFLKNNEMVNLNTLELCSEILEGGRAALATRVRKIGHKNIFIGEK